MQDDCLITASFLSLHFWGMRQLSDSFSEVVRKAREAKKLSKAALAKKAGLHQTYIGLLERGERTPNLDTAKAIADALGIQLEKMIAEAERMNRD